MCIRDSNYSFVCKPASAHEERKNAIPKGYVAPVFGIDDANNSAFGIHGRIFHGSNITNRLTAFFNEDAVTTTNVISYDAGIGSSSNLYAGPGLYGSSLRNSLELLFQVGAESEVANNIVLFADYSIVVTGEDSIRNEGVFKFGVGLGL